MLAISSVMSLSLRACFKVKIKYSKMSLLRSLEIKTTSLFRPVFASPKWNFPYDILFDIKTISLMRLPKIGILR